MKKPVREKLQEDLSIVEGQACFRGAAGAPTRLLRVGWSTPSEPAVAETS